MLGIKQQSSLILKQKGRKFHNSEFIANYSNTDFDKS